MSTILVIDDDRANRMLIATLLSYGGHRVFEAEGALEGLAIVRALKPDLMIVDIQMPGMDGYEFVRQLRSESDIADSNIMFYTATYEPHRALALATKVGVPVVLTKPIDPETLLDTVERALRDNAKAPSVDHSPEFDQAHFRMVADKLTEKVAETRDLGQRLTTLVQLSIGLTVEQELPHLFERFGRTGSELLEAQYTAIGIVADGAKALEHFYVYSADHLGHLPPPQLTGLLSQLSMGQDLVCSSGCTDEPLTIGLPERCGLIRNFLGTALVTPKRRYGWIYFAQKHGAESFTYDDQRVARSLAAQLAVAYENATLYIEVQQHAQQLEARVSERTAELERSYAELERSRRKELEVKDHFLAHVSHELRAPLAASHLFVRNLLDGLSGTLNIQQRDDLEVVLRNIDQLRGMIGDLLEATRADGGQLRIERGPTNISTLISEAIATFAASAGTICLSREVQSDVPMVFADMQRVRQILNNLLDNAIKYTPPGGRISIRAHVLEPSREFVQIEVADSGRGLSADGINRVFERMYQEQPQDDFPRGGLGLGLYICRLLVERHSGRIWAESEPGQGSTFLFTLPVIDGRNSSSLHQHMA